MIDERIVGNVVERILHGVGNRLFHGRNVVMTPEEIEELRALVGRLGANAYDKNLAVVLGAALEHIDQQATRIAELESQIIQQTGISASRMEERERLQKQIAALQEIAVEERASMMACSEYEPPVTDKRLRGTARDHLAEEHPEAFG